MAVKNDDELLIIKGFLIGLFVFIGVAVIAAERWLYDYCMKYKFKKLGIKTKGFINTRKQALNGKSLMTFHSMDIEFLAQNNDKTKQYIIYLYIHLMPKVEYMMNGYDHSLDINIRYIPDTTYNMKGDANKNEIQYYLIGDKPDIDSKPTYKKKKCWKNNLKLFLISVCLVLGNIPFLWAIDDKSFFNVGFIVWGLGILFGTIYFLIKPKVTFQQTVVKIKQDPTDDDLKKYLDLKDLELA